VRYRSAVAGLAATAGALPASAVGAGPVSVTPNANGLPDTAKLQQLVDGAYMWVLMLTLGALIVAAAVWAWGSQSNNVRAASDGRRGVAVALLAAMVIGAAPTLVNWFYGLGR
jgi:hypothetical protein